MMELKNCPCCGREVELYAGKFVKRIYCVCGLEMPATTVDALITNWNRRTTNEAMLNMEIQQLKDELAKVRTLISGYPELIERKSK